MPAFPPVFANARSKEDGGKKNTSELHSETSAVNDSKKINKTTSKLHNASFCANKRAISCSLVSSDSAFFPTIPLPTAVIQESLTTRLPKPVHSMLRLIVGHQTVYTLHLISYMHKPKKEALNKQKGPQEVVLSEQPATKVR